MKKYNYKLQIRDLKNKKILKINKKLVDKNQKTKKKIY